MTQDREAADHDTRPRKSLTVAKALLFILSIVLLGWVLLAYLAYAFLAQGAGNSTPLHVIPMVMGACVLALLVMWRVGVRVAWLATFVTAACLVQILVWFG